MRSSRKSRSSGRECGTAAIQGATLGGALGALGAAGNRVLEGTVKKSNALTNLENDVARANALPGAAQRDLFVPVSQGADKEDPISSVVAGFYRGGLPYVPGVAGQLNSQSNKAIDSMMGTMLQHGAPDGYVVPAQATKDMQLSTKQVSDAHDAIYQDLRKVDNVAYPATLKYDIEARIRKADPQIPKSDAQQFAQLVEDDLKHQAENNSTGRINAFNLKNTRDNIPTLLDRIGKEMPAEQASTMYGESKAAIDDLFGAKLQQAFNLGHQGAQDILSKYKLNAPNYENFRPLKDAVEAAKANTGRFIPGGVAKRANDFTDIQGMDQNFKEIFGTKAVQPTAAARVAGYPIVAGIGHLAGPAAAGLTVAGANAMATKGFQQMLYGNTALQRSMKAYIAAHPEIAAKLAYATKSGLVQAAGLGRNEDEP